MKPHLRFWHYYSPHCLLTKRSQNKENCDFLLVLCSNFSLTFSKTKFWKPRQFQQPCEPKHEVLGLLPSSLLHFLITKRAQNQETRAFLIVFRSFFLTHNKLKSWQPRQIFQPFEPSLEVLGQLTSTLLSYLTTKRDQIKEKREFLLIFRSFFLLMLS